MSFKLFMEEDEDKDINKTLEKIPSNHRNLLQGFNLKLTSGNTLKGDSDHIGYMDEEPKKIVVASPWNYGREFTFLHEIGHKVWETLSHQERQEWAHIVKHTKNKKIDQNIEELFCMAYAQHFTDTKLKKFDFIEWTHFLNKICNRMSHEKF